VLDVDTFLTTLYVMVDDFCHSQPPKRRPGPQASLSDSEVITLAIFARWGRLCGERDFYRYARRRLHDTFQSWFQNAVVTPRRRTSSTLKDYVLSW